MGQVAGVGISFVIPIFLSRWLAVEAYGTYKQLMLIHTFLLLTVHMGIDWGLFYFMKREPRKSSIFSLNAMSIDFLLSVLVIFIGLLASPWLSAALKNPTLKWYLPAFAPFVLFSIPAHHFNHYLVVVDKIKEAMWLTVFYEGCKTLIIIGGYFFFNSLIVVLLALGGLALVRFCLLLIWNLRLHRRNHLDFREHLPYLSTQMRLALPLGVSNLITLILRLDRFVVSFLFGLRQFTLYSVGCFELPVVESTVITMADLMSFDMVEANREKDGLRIKDLWLSTIRKIALFHIPLTVYMIFFSREVITFLYSNAYAESARFFSVFSMIFMLSAFTPEVVFRVFAQSKLLLKIRTLAAVYTLSLVTGLALLLGPMGALLGKLIADILTTTLQLRSMGKLMELRIEEWLPWRTILAVTFSSLLCVAWVSSLFRGLHLNGFLTVVLSFSIYGLSVFVFSATTGILRTEELRYLKEKLVRPLLLRWT